MNWYISELFHRKADLERNTASAMNDHDHLDNESLADMEQSMADIDRSISIEMLWDDHKKSKRRGIL